MGIQDGLPGTGLWPEQVYTLPELRYPRKLNVARELLDRHAEGDLGGRPAIFFGDRTLTYGELARQVNRLAHGLRQLGLGPEDRLLLRLPNCPEFIITWLACQKLGVVTVATMPMLRARELGYITTDAGIRAAVVASDLRDELEKAMAQAGHRAPLVVVGEPRGGDVTWQRLAEGHPDRFPSLETDGDAVAMMAYTSGSTGVPKGCLHTHRDILASADSYARSTLTPSAEDRFGGHPTLAFTYGSGGLMAWPLRFGASTVLMGQFSPEAMLETIQRYQLTVCFCVPTSFKRMLRVPEMERWYDVKSLRLAVSAGEPLPAATYEEWVERTGSELLDGIGTTELLSIFISSVRGRVRPGSTGVPVPGYDCRVVDETGAELPPGQTGLLAIKGPTGCKYWKKPDRQAEYVRFGGWNVTGDLYLKDEDGYFWYQCRADDMIVSAGYKIPGPEIEHVLDEHPAVAESAVVASPDPTRGSVPKAFIVLKAGHGPSPALVAQLQEHVKKELAPYKYPRLVEFVDRLPRTETGKIRRVELRQRELGGDSS